MGSEELPWWQETQAGIKIAGRNISNLRYADDTTLMGESEEELKSLLMKVKEESEKIGLKLNIQKTKSTWWAAVSGVAQSRPRLKRLSSSSSMKTSLPFWKDKKRPSKSLPI